MKCPFCASYQDSEELSSQEGKGEVDPEFGNGYCEGGNLIHANVSLNQVSISPLFSFSLLPFNVA